MTGQEIDYNALTEKLLGDALLYTGEARLHGDAAAAAGRALLLGEYGSDKAINQAIRSGRPRVGDAKRGPSPVVRGRIADSDYASLAKVGQLTGKSESALVREAIQMLLQKYQVAS
ncbi:hypothetical protein ACX80D_10255 [Arthrobacter sp. Sr24]